MASKILPVAPFPAVVKQRERASARRLQLDRIPLYQIHQPNPVFPDSVIMPGMRSLLDSGDIGAAGVSNYSLERWQKADAALGPPGDQQPGGLLTRPPWRARDLVPFAERENRIVIAYSPLAQGLLGGKYGPEQPARRCPRGELVVRHGEPAAHRAAAADAARRRRRSRRQARAGGAGLADQLAGRGRDSRARPVSSSSSSTSPQPTSS